MKLTELNEFRLVVGGTALSLQLGHRTSVDIDLFTDANYGSINFNKIINDINQIFAFVDYGQWNNIASGNACYINKF